MPFVRFSGQALIVLSAVFLIVAAFLKPVDSPRSGRDTALEPVVETTTAVRR